VPAFNTILQLEESADAVYERVSRTLRFPGPNTSVHLEKGGLFFEVTRRYRPGWATWLGVIGLFTLVGGLLLFYTKTEELAISIYSRVGGGCTVIVSGDAKQTMIHRVQGALLTPTRPCPTCNALMMREARICPGCGTDSDPWIFHNGVWWRHDQVSGWQWLWLGGPNLWRSPVEWTDAGRAAPTAAPAPSASDSN
jgi:hypothetical protein